MRKSTIVWGLIALATAVLITALNHKTPAVADVVAPAQAEKLQTAVAETPVQTEGFVQNSDGSVIVRGNASFTMAPISSVPPPAMVSENEARRLSSPK